ncbi:SH3 domain-containing protein [Streptococcus vestibularis]|uniref:SH3 domain-containing protein n=1 Tax=Streptococcus vestibularis TaxID=1343 RepID=UPI0020015039|nr:SH3 domain-containing protein [Streptococcus vestibularis]
MRKAYVFKERQRYSIRKYSFGAASVLIGASLMLGGHALAQEQANSVNSNKDNEVIVNNSEALQVDQATPEAVTDVLNQPASRSEAPRPKLANSEVASSETSSIVASEAASLEVPAEVAHSASVVATVSRSEVASPRSEVSLVASSEAASETDRSATSEVAEARPTDREAVDTSLRTVLTNASQPGVDGPVTADGSLDIPSNGTFYFRRTTEIRTAPIMDIKPTFVFSAGDHVIYDKVLKRDSHQWISYIGYDSERYYADIATLKAESTSSTTEVTRDETIPERGTYYFTKPADVKNQPSFTAKTEFNFDPGMSVNYDRSLLADNHRWISYVSYNGTRRYVDLGIVAESLAKPTGNIAIESHDNGGFSVVISNVADQNGVLGVSVPIWSEKNGQDDIIWYNATRLNNGNYKVNVSLSDHKNERGLYNVHLYYVETNGKLVGVSGTTYTVPAKVEGTHTTASYSLPDSGTYTFKERSSIKAEPRVASPELAYYDTGMSVNYDKIVSGDGYQWLSYLSYSGNRRYVAVAKLAQQESKPSGTINIENLSNLGFDVHITNVSSGDKAIQGVSVPVWTAKNGQDDLVWYQADRQSDGSYKVRINVTDHKAEAGEYIVHLYYVQDGKMVGIGGTSTTVPVQSATRHNLPASGSYTFTARTGIKTQPLLANPDVSYYDAGMSVNYDKVVNNDGYTWLSYLSYSGHRFYVAIAPTSVTKPVEQPVQPNTSSSGTYTFKERSSIKAEPSMASPELAYYDAGMSVNYDKLVTADGHTWLSYVSYGGNRRYIAIDGKVTAVAQPASPSLAATGTYTFTKSSSIKAQPSVASPELAYYDKGMSVRYDKVLTADGHTWLSYVTYSGARRYVDIS